MATVNSLVHTSADDCKISLKYVHDTELLNEALLLATGLGRKTIAKHITSRIKQIEKSL
jgi:hypothetical protein